MLSLAMQTFVEAWFVAAQENTGSVFTMFEFQRQSNLKLFYSYISGKSSSTDEATTAIFFTHKLPQNESAYLS